MQAVFDFLTRVLRRMLKLALFLLAGALALGLVTVVLAAVLLHAVWSLMMGRKPAVFTTYTRFRQATQAFRQRGAGFEPAARPFDAVDVVDVQAVEVNEPSRSGSHR
jgi:uncharacterized membrane protein